LDIDGEEDTDFHEQETYDDVEQELVETIPRTWTMHGVAFAPDQVEISKKIR
jgi:hypothetical protein